MAPRRFSITVLPSAHLNLAEIEEYIGRDSPANAAAVGDRILARIETLREMPHRYPICIAQGELPYPVRCMSVRPYRVFYAVVETRVIVLRIRHGRQEDLRAEDL